MIHVGDCLEVMRGMTADSIDAIVTDPPYGLSFMGKKWDYDVPSTEIWAECLRVLKPGGHLLAFAGTRTQHRMAVRIEDAGFEIRDMIAWVYGSGFPKSLDVSKAIDKAGGQPWAQFGPMLDRLIKEAGYNYTSLDRALGIPSAGSNSCYWVRSDERGGLPPRSYFEQLKDLLNPPSAFTDLYDKAEREVIAIERRKNAPSGIVGAGRESVEIERQITIAATEAGRRWDGWGTGLKPALEPITMARKPLIGSVAANVLAHGTGALNIDECGIGAKFSDGGRWPANLIHDGSDEVLAAFPTAPGQQGRAKDDREVSGNAVYGALRNVTTNPEARGDRGSAARFFYCAKASKADRDAGLAGIETKRAGMVSNTSGQHITRRDSGYEVSPRANNHPTVKPADLMRYLCRLVTPRGGLILDPFTGSGSTGRAALMEGFQFVGIELDPDYAAIAEARIRAVQPGLALGDAA